MCGDGIEMLPCSHVGHAYRSSIIWNDQLREAEKTVSNSYRVAEVWMDEYKDLVFERIGNYTLKTGDVSKVKKFKKENNCKPFEYFLEYVTEIVHLYIPVNLKAKGAIIKPDGKTCLGNCNLNVCLAECKWKGYWQFWEWSSDKEIRQGVNCLIPKENNLVEISECKFNKFVQWDYREDNLIKNIDTGMCLTADEENKLKLAECTGHSEQIWIWERTIKSITNSRRALK
ncbi:GALNT [Mytilus coruscus]|uniref:GALNT n=1 Tax=Mytilus coruscus TaxID=42192 RepID=A0A6J8A321_MYTCO|nr:GALNT [Mytilus coruscus]